MRRTIRNNGPSKQRKRSTEPSDPMAGDQRDVQEDADQSNPPSHRKTELDRLCDLIMMVQARIDWAEQYNIAKVRFEQIALEDARWILTLLKREQHKWR